MPTYAVLGGSGNIGVEIIKHLTKSPDNILHIYARSQSRLLELHPFLADAASPHKLFIGNLNDVELFTDCIAGASVVFGVVGTNANNPDCHVAQDLASVIIGALSRLRSAGQQKPPTVLFVTSAGMTSDKRVRANFSAPLHWFLQKLAGYIYEDFRQAVKLFAQADNHWIPVIYICAPGLEKGPSQGAVYAGVNIPKKAPQYVTYTDLAKGMIQAAVEPDLLIHKEIGVAGAKQPPLHYGSMLVLLSTNLMCSWAPPLWRIGYRRGWWGHK